MSLFDKLYEQRKSRERLLRQCLNNRAHRLLGNMYTANMKTLLPEKLKDGHPLYDINLICNHINQIITYLDELTKVVEGKQDNISRLMDETLDKDLLERMKPTPTLKETLLGEIKQKSGPRAWDLISVGEVEAIINRLIP